MALGHEPLCEPEIFGPLAETITKYGLKAFVETGTGPCSSGMQVAHMLNMQGFTCDVDVKCVVEEVQRHPKVQAMHCESLQFLKIVLPQIGEWPTFFWLDGHCPTERDVAGGAFEHIFPLYDELVLIRELKANFHKDVLWLDDIAMIDVPDNPVASRWDVDLAGTRWRGAQDHSWADYLAVFADTHNAEIVGSMLRLTPK